MTSCVRHLDGIFLLKGSCFQQQSSCNFYVNITNYSNAFFSVATQKFVYDLGYRWMDLNRGLWCRKRPLNQLYHWATEVGPLAERLLLRPEVCGSHPVISKTFIQTTCLLSRSERRKWRKRGREWPVFVKKIFSITHFDSFYFFHHERFALSSPIQKL